MNGTSNSTTQGLGIASLVLGILSIPLAIIPCTFWLALVFGVTGIVLASVALSTASRQNASKGIVIAGLVCSIIGTMIGGAWTLFFRPDNIQRKLEKLEQKFDNDFDQDKFDSKMKEISKELEEKLENLESKKDSVDIDINWNDTISDEDFEEIIDAYQNLMENYIDAANNAQGKSAKAISIATVLAVKTTQLTTDLLKHYSKLTDEQKQELQKIRERYESTYKEMEKQLEEEEE